MVLMDSLFGHSYQRLSERQLAKHYRASTIKKTQRTGCSLPPSTLNHLCSHMDVSGLAFDGFGAWHKRQRLMIRLHFAHMQVSHANGHN